MSDDEDSAWEAGSQESVESSTEEKEGTRKAQPTTNRPAALQKKDPPTSKQDDVKLLSPRPKKLRRTIITEEEIAAESNIPSHERLTVNGGYAATAAHRKKISLANSGNVPWNKGRHRSEQDKAKIKAAVQARNRKQMLVNLATIGMSEEENTKLKKKIKLVRENIRKTKLNVMRQRESKERQRKRESVESSEDTQGTDNEEEEEEEEKEEEDDSDDDYVAVVEQNTTVNIPPTTPPMDNTVTNPPVAAEGDIHMNLPSVVAAQATLDPKPATSLTRPTVQAISAAPAEPRTQNNGAIESVQRKGSDTTLPYDIEQIPEMFRHDFEWEEPTAFDCPKGGPGGLLCCNECGKAYSDVLSHTFQQLERQKLNKVAAEVESISKFMELNHTRLTSSVHKAQQKPPPMVLKDT